MFSDIVGYTSIMGESEKNAFQTINTNREIHQRYVVEHHGKIVKDTGSGHDPGPFYVLRCHRSAGANGTGR
jgi:hypothetical protein